MRGFSIPRKLSKRVGKYQPMRDWTKLRASSTVYSNIRYAHILGPRISIISSIGI